MRCTASIGRILGVRGRVAQRTSLPSRIHRSACAPCARNELAETLWWPGRPQLAARANAARIEDVRPPAAPAGQTDDPPQHPPVSNHRPSASRLAPTYPHASSRSRVAARRTCRRRGHPPRSIPTRAYVRMPPIERTHVRAPVAARLRLSRPFDSFGRGAARSQVRRNAVNDRASVDFRLRMHAPYTLTHVSRHATYARALKGAS